MFPEVFFVWAKLSLKHDQRYRLTKSHHPLTKTKQKKKHLFSGEKQNGLKGLVENKGFLFIYFYEKMKSKFLELSQKRMTSSSTEESHSQSAHHRFFMDTWQRIGAHDCETTRAFALYFIYTVSMLITLWESDI